MLSIVQNNSLLEELRTHLAPLGLRMPAFLHLMSVYMLCILNLAGFSF